MPFFWGNSIEIGNLPIDNEFNLVNVNPNVLRGNDLVGTPVKRDESGDLPRLFRGEPFLNFLQIIPVVWGWTETQNLSKS